MIGKTVSHYRIIEKIGSGGMGEVYLAEDTELHRKVALKFLPPGYSSDPDVFARFRREAQAAAALDHPNIITIHQVAMHEDRPYIVMAHVEGLPLGDYVSRKKPSLKAILDLAIQIGEGLAKAHGAGVVHRDLKPDNILVDDDGRPKILDFGLAKQAGVTKITQEASTLGTIYYMSPEQTRGEDVDHRSDIFSLGTVLYEMLTRHLPFQGEHTTAVMYAITGTTPQPLARYNNEVTPELERIVAKMLAKDPRERYQSAADLVADLRRERRLSDSAVHTPPPAPGAVRAGGRRSNALKFGIPVAAAVLIAFFLIFKPFRVDISSDQPATASENSLAVMYFENMIDPGDEKRNGEIIANLLITALSDAEHLRVVSSQRLYDILKALDKEGTRVIDRNTATQVATRAGARQMLLGNIVQTNPTMVVTYQLVDVASGDVEDSKRIDGRRGESVFQLVDRMTVQLEDGLALPGAGTSRTERSVADMTTSSPEAYRIYLEGVELLNKNYKEQAIASFQRVLEIDSTMALAAARLTTPNLFSLTERQRMNYARQAYRHRDRVGEADRHRINALYALNFGTTADIIAELETVIAKVPDDKEAYLTLGAVYWKRVGDRLKALEYTRKAAKVDPNNKLAYNQQAYVYLDLREYAKAMEALDTYIAIAPDEPNPYDSRAEVYAFMGRLDESIRWYEKAVEIDPNFGLAKIRLALMYALNRDFDKALSLCQTVSESGDPRAHSAALVLRIVAPSMQGRVRDALAEADRAIEQDKTAGVDHGFFHYTKYWMKAALLAALDRGEPALATVRRAEELETTSDGPSDALALNVAEQLALAGKIDEATALIDAHLPDPARSDIDARSWYAYVKGIVAFERGEYEKAAGHFESSVEADPAFLPEYYRALAYLRGGRITDAVAAYRAVVHRYDPARVENPIASTLCHYYAGLAYEQAGLGDDALAEYEEFLDICDGADPDFEGLEDARSRVERLRQGS